MRDRRDCRGDDIEIFHCPRGGDARRVHCMNRVAIRLLDDGSRRFGNERIDDVPRRGFREPAITVPVCVATDSSTRWIEGQVGRRVRRANDGIVDNNSMNVDTMRNTRSITGRTQPCQVRRPSAQPRL